MKRLMGWCLLFALCSYTANAAVTIGNVTAAQRQGTKLVDIQYDVDSDSTNVVDVALRLSDGSTDVAAYTFSGDIGSGVSTGANKLIVWDAEADQSNIVATVQVHLTIDDGAMDPNVYVPPCPVPQTGQTNSYVPGDDGDLQKGVAWPRPRFEFVEFNGGVDEVYIDHLTGLMWNVHRSYNSTYGANEYGWLASSWSNAVASCNSSVHAGYSDWRLPSVKELETLRHCGNYPVWDYSLFESNAYMHSYWTGTTDPTMTNRAWVYVPYEGTITRVEKQNSFTYYMSVRTIGSQALSSIPKSGQSVSYLAGDDGDLQPGTEWPNPRFIENSDTVTDRLTGLVWLKDANALGLARWGSAVSNSFALVTAGYDDWRLPTLNELASLIDHSQYNPALPAGHPFLNVQNDIYWTGTKSELPWEDQANVILMGSGQRGDMMSPQAQIVTNQYRIWPVRGGE